MPGGVAAPGGVPGPRDACSGGVPAPRGLMPAPGGCLVETPRTVTAAGGIHPTGMHSCLMAVIGC